MRRLTDEDQARLEEVARRHGVGVDAASTLLQALYRGGGTQAQFSHPELGGMGQWSRHGMLMIGDMFNDGLKARVGALCTELSDLLQTPGISKVEPADIRAGPGRWWPTACGTPGASGSQNDMSYAYFPETRRLAIRRDGEVQVYDTGDHRISGASQQQGGSQDLSFTSQRGTVRLHELALVGADERPSPRPASASVAEESAAEPPQDDVFAKIERLHELHRQGVLDDAEYAATKKQLLARL